MREGDLVCQKNLKDCSAVDVVRDENVANDYNADFKISDLQQSRILFAPPLKNKIVCQSFEIVSQNQNSHH